MSYFQRIFPAMALFAAVTLSAQTQSQVVTGGYTAPCTESVAAGGVLTLFVPDLNVPDAVATGTPWPNSLSGVTVAVRVIGQGDSTGYPAYLPINRVYTQNPCSAGALLCPNTQITVQIPFELVCVVHCSTPPYPTNAILSYPPQLVLNVKANGITEPDLVFSVFDYVPHLLNSCDALFGPADPASCHPMVTHADGGLVNNARPARVGETLVLYAVGLTGAGLKTGFSGSE